MLIGYVGIFSIVFIESGIIIGVFLPGDSLLFTAGLLASQGHFNLSMLIVGIFTAAVTGSIVGYTFGNKVGVKLFERENSRFFHKENLQKAEKFYIKHGAKTIVLARFLPVVRTFAPVLAGIGNMEYRRFLLFNILGAAIWAGFITAAGYYLGKVFPNVIDYLLPIIGLIIIISFLPSAIHIYRDRRA